MNSEGNEPLLKLQFDLLVKLGNQSIELSAYVESVKFGQRANQYTQSTDEDKKEVLLLMFEDLLQIERDKLHRRELAADKRVESLESMIKKLKDENITLADRVQMLEKVVKRVANDIGITIPVLSRQSNKPVANTDQSESEN